MKLIWLWGMFFGSFLQTLHGQVLPEDSLSASLKPPHSVQKAVRYSAMLPGLGQAYNQKYWKIPIIYGLGGFTVYSAIASQRSYLVHRDAYRLRSDGDPTTVDVFEGIQGTEQLRQNRDQFRENRDLFWILTAVVYGLNLVDASVDAHLFDFNVSDDLSVQMFRSNPALSASPTSFSLPVATLTLKL